MLKKVILALASMTCLSFSYESAKDMDLEEKIGQMLLVHFHGEAANEDAKTLVQKVKVGGFIYYNWATGLHSPEQVAELSQGLQALTRENSLAIPLFIAADQEGGIVSRLKQGFTTFPGNFALGMSGDPTLAEKSAFAMGLELRSVGVNYNLSPVADINSNPKNPVIGLRSFGSTADIVAAFVQRAVEGYHQAKIITSLKHFPGHGDVEVDSHKDLPVINKSKEELEKMEFIPFAKMAPKADTVMTAHVMLPKIDPVHCATLSKNVLDILRNDLQFAGVIISDSLVMKGLLKNCSSVDDAAIQAINAGCDIICLGGKQLNYNDADLELSAEDIQRIHRNIASAVKKGIISEERIDEAVTRILQLKTKYLGAPSKNPPPISSLERKKHASLAKQIATHALKIQENTNSACSLLQNMKLAIFAPAAMKEKLLQTSILQLGKEIRFAFFQHLSPSKKEIQAAKDLEEQSDMLLFFSYNAWKNASQKTLIKSLIARKKPLILIVVKDPLDAGLFPKADKIYTTFSPTTPAIQAVCDDLLSNLHNCSKADK